MGMDLYIYQARNHEVFKHEYWNMPDVKEVFYARKAWHFPHHCNFVPENYESGDFFEIGIDEVENMIEVACEYRNYFGNYNDVPKLCELRDQMVAEVNGHEETGIEIPRYFMAWDW